MQQGVGGGVAAGRREAGAWPGRSKPLRLRERRFAHLSLRTDREAFLTILSNTAVLGPPPQRRGPCGCIAGVAGMATLTGKLLGREAAVAGCEQLPTALDCRRQPSRRHALTRPTRTLLPEVRSWGPTVTLPLP